MAEPPSKERLNALSITGLKGKYSSDKAFVTTLLYGQYTEGVLHAQ